MDLGDQRGGLPEAAGLMDVITGLDLRRLEGHQNPIALTFVRPLAQNQAHSHWRDVWSLLPLPFCRVPFRWKIRCLKQSGEVSS